MVGVEAAFTRIGMTDHFAAVADAMPPSALRQERASFERTLCGTRVRAARHYCVSVIPLQLRSEPSIPALVLDVVVFLIAFPAALESDGPAWLRVLCGVIALVAAVLGVRSAALMYTNR